MTALLSFFIGNPALLGMLASIIAGLGWGFHQRLAGASAERARQAATETASREIANQIQNDIGALPAETTRKELKSWAKD